MRALRGSKRLRMEEGMRWPKEAVRRRLEGEGVWKGSGIWGNSVGGDREGSRTYRPVLESCSREGESGDGETFGEEAEWGCRTRSARPHGD